MGEYVELSLPARPDLLFLVRFHLAAAAAHIDLGVEDVDDLRLAVDELCLSLLNLSPGPGQRLDVTFGWDESSIDAICKVSGSTGIGVSTTETGGNRTDAAVLPADLSALVLGALVDEHGIYYEDGHAVAWLRKKRIAIGQHA